MTEKTRGRPRIHEKPVKPRFQHWSDSVKKNCGNLWNRGYTLPEITKATGVPDSTLQKWRAEYKWNKRPSKQTVEEALAERICLLTERDNKSEKDLKELDRLIDKIIALNTSTENKKLIEAEAQYKLAKAMQVAVMADNMAKGIVLPSRHNVALDEQGEVVATEKIPKQRSPKPKKVKNDISSITAEKLAEIRNEIFYDYQKLWHRIKNDAMLGKFRFILKSRQIGATFYFAWEAFEDAVLTGDDQLFLSASRDQAEVFKAYIIAFAKKYFDVELKGAQFIELSNGAFLRFLSTNSSTAQSYHGHFYIDEVFWIPNFKKMKMVAGGMASHKKWRMTLFSTPSSIGHEAYDTWSGKEFNQNKPESEQIDFDISHDNLKYGRYGNDRIWRHIVTVKDAQANGCDLFDIEDLQARWSKDDFDCLYMCKFIDDSASVFNINKLLECTIEDEHWQDYKPHLDRPFANKAVSIGYDPSRKRDKSSLAVMSVPTKTENYWRVLDIKGFWGTDFKLQANEIKSVLDSHHVVHLGIDTTGIGQGLFDIVTGFYTLATPINYSTDMKNNLVVKAIDVVNSNRLKYLSKHTEITRALMMITRSTTGEGKITYSAGRNQSTGHADVAWAIMHALIYEPTNYETQRKTTVSISG